MTLSSWVWEHMGGTQNLELPEGELPEGAPKRRRPGDMLARRRVEKSWHDCPGVVQSALLEQTRGAEDGCVCIFR